MQLWHQISIILSTVASLGAVVFILWAYFRMDSTEVKNVFRGIGLVTFGIALTNLSGAYFMINAKGTSAYKLGMTSFHAFLVLTAIAVLYTVYTIYSFVDTFTMS